MIHEIGEALSLISKSRTLNPRDLLVTGTPREQVIPALHLGFYKLETKLRSKLSDWARYEAPP